jgi:hypothetical protein
MTTTIKITELTDIGANLASSTVLPVVNMAGTPTTQKTVMANIANLVLAGAGGDYVAAATATTANTVITNAQPNITSIGNLTGLTVSNATGVVNFSNTANVTLGAVANLRITGGSNGQTLTTNGSGNLSWANVSGGNGIPSGSNTQIQFNDVGAFGGNTGFTFDKTTGVLAAPFASVSGVANIVGGGATVATKSVLNVASTFGSNSSEDPASAQAIRGRVTGSNLSQTRNYVTGVTGQYLVTGTNASEFIKAGVLGVVGDQTTTADGAVVAYLDGDGGLTTANAAYAVSMNNSTPNSGFNYGLDLQFISLNLGGVTTSTFKQADIRFNNGVKLVANTAGNISINANVTAGNLITGGTLSVTGNATVGNIIATNLGNVSTINLTGNSSNVLYGNGVFAAVAGGANTGNIGFDDTVIYSNTGLVINNSDPTHGTTAGLSIPAQGDGNATQLFNTYGNVILQAANIGNSEPTVTWTFGTDGTTTFPTANIDLHNGGVQSGEVLQFGNPNLQAIITGPTPSANVSAQRLIIQGQRGNGTGEGGDVYVWAGDADTNGGDIKIYAGDADNVSTGTGGYVNLAGGDGFDSGGGINIDGGSSANATGGHVSIAGGYGQIDGGTASLQGGYGADGQGGAVQITGGGSSNGTGSFGNVVLGSGVSGWIFDNTGNLTLPANTFAVNYANGTQVSIGGGSGNTGNVTFDDNIVIGTGDEYGYSGLYLAPGTNSTANLQYLRVRGGDYPTHIHLDTGNNAYFDQYFGDDGKYVKLANTGEVVIGSNDATGNSASWTFDTGGNLTLPEDATISDFGETASLNVDGSGRVAQLYWNGNIGNGNPDNGGDYYTWAYVASGGFFIQHENVATSTDNLWGFGIDGNLTLPGNLVITGNANVFGTNSSLIKTTDGRPLLSLSSGSNGAVSSVWVEDIGNIGTSNIAAVYANPTPGSGIVRIAVGQNGGGGPNLWDFGTTGNLTLPGNTFAINYANGTQVALGGGNSSSIANGNSNVNVATANGNVTIAAVGNTTMTVTGTGANIIGYANVSGNITANNLGNISSLNLNGNASAVLYGNGIFAAVAGGSSIVTTGYNVGANTVVLAGAIKVRYNGMGDIELQATSGTIGAYWAGQYITATTSTTLESNRSLTTSVWWAIGANVGSTGDTITITLMDTTNGKIYRVTTIVTPTGNCGSIMIETLI